MSKDLKLQARAIVKRLNEYRADYESILNDIEELRRESMAGIVQEKFSVKTAQCVPVVEKYPAVALQCLQLKTAILRDLDTMDNEEEDADFQLSINIVPLETFEH